MTSSARPSAAALFERYGATVYRRCLALLRQEELARDAVQEVFLRVVAQLGGFRGESSPLTWIYSIATLYCLQQLRNQRRSERKLHDLLATADPPPTASLEDKVALAALLEGADREVQQIVVLRLIDGMTGDEVAELTGLSRKTVTRRLQEFIAEARADLGREAAP
jgi:RNA polymerase sigma-70 factor (ECF subfamily)